MFSIYNLSMQRIAYLVLAGLWLAITPVFATDSSATDSSATDSSVIEAERAASAWQSEGPAQARLIAGLAPNGAEVIGVEIRLRTGWHTYWHTPGASGIAPNFDWTGSLNVSLSEPLYQAPRRFAEKAGDSFGYADGTIFLVPITPLIPTSLTPLIPHAQTDDKEQVQLRLHLDIGVCREICIPISFDLALDILPAAFKQSPHHALLNSAYQKLPAQASKELQVAALTYDGVSLNMIISGQNLTKTDIIIAGNELDVFDRPRIVGRDKSAWLVEIPAWAALDTPFIGRSLHIVLNNGTHAIAQTMLVSHPQ